MISTEAESCAAAAALVEVFFGYGLQKSPTNDEDFRKRWYKRAARTDR